MRFSKYIYCYKYIYILTNYIYKYILFLALLINVYTIYLDGSILKVEKSIGDYAAVTKSDIIFIHDISY